MFAQASLIALSTSAVFGSLALMSDRPRGALLAQLGIALAGVIVMAAHIFNTAILGVSPFAIIAFAIAIMAACVAGMLYHLYLGRFTRVWTARGVFTLVFLVTSAVFGFVFLPLI